MPDIALQCTCCGYMLTFPEEAAVRICPACATPNARPVVEDNALDMLGHAIRQRLGCDFANAERSYQQVLLDYPDAHEALWGRLLCHYGVEYVEDPASHQLMPTVHTVRRKPLRLQPEFRDACAFAPDDVRIRYEQEAVYIDNAQAAIRQAAESCPPYDVFLCHKTTKPGTGEKTADYERALQLYYYLREQGLRPFFAPQSLVGLAGADYEAGIYHAIDTAKVMLVLCSQKDYITSAWVRSEWSRYIERIDEGADKTLVPLLFDHFNPLHLPAEFRFRRIQGFPMGELTSTEKLMTMLREKVGKPAPEKAAAPEKPALPEKPAAPEKKAVPEKPAAPVKAPAPAAPVTQKASQPAPRAATPVPEQAAASPNALIEAAKKRREELTVGEFKVKPCENGYAVTAYTGKDDVISIPETLNGWAVVRIAANAFENTAIREVTLPGSVVQIEGYVFRGCKALHRVNLPEGLNSIGVAAFFGCSALESIVLPESLTYIDMQGFEYCTALKEINIPPKVKICTWAFDNCPKLPAETRKLIRKHMSKPAQLFSLLVR
ncbi:MAG: leucine-rich repeat protein [Clostridia bacterium]|nr:leucine-rich repeat protein [Clostridia bacterium]